MKRLILPHEKNEYEPVGIYCYQQEKRKSAFLNLFLTNREEDIINEKRIENLKELRGDYH